MELMVYRVRHIYLKDIWNEKRNQQNYLDLGPLILDSFLVFKTLSLIFLLIELWPLHLFTMTNLPSNDAFTELKNHATFNASKSQNSIFPLRDV